MKEIEIEMFPARCGDCFLIRLNNGKNIVIDMGYKDTYTDFVRERFIELKKQGQCIDLLIITHIDEDHIQGAIEFIEENGHIDNPNIISVKEVWHNSYRHLQFRKRKVENISNIENKILKELINNDKTKIDKSINEKQAISATQGSTLAGYLYKYGYLKNSWNRSFESNAVNLDYKNIITMGDINITIISPNTKKLERLSKFWHGELNRSKLGFDLSNEIIFDDAYEVYLKNLRDPIEYEESQEVSSENKKHKSLEDFIGTEITQNDKDKRKPNGSSIAFILEYKGKKVLFLGDSHEDIVFNELEEIQERLGPQKFDAIKVSHHGSIKNNYKWIDLIKSDRYLISTNGEKYSHPDYEFITKLITSNLEHKRFYFNYRVNVSLELENEELKNKYNYSIIIGREDKTTKIEI